MVSTFLSRKSNQFDRHRKATPPIPRTVIAALESLRLRCCSTSPPSQNELVDVSGEKTDDGSGYHSGHRSGAHGATTQRK
jgi:hypothetical protein